MLLPWIAGEDDELKQRMPLRGTHGRAVVLHPGRLQRAEERLGLAGTRLSLRAVPVRGSSRRAPQEQPLKSRWFEHGSRQLVHGGRHLEGTARQGDASREVRRLPLLTRQAPPRDGSGISRRACVRARGNRTIEDIYQGAKVFEDGSTGLGWRAAKGRTAANMEEVQILYARLWDEYMNENPELMEVITAASGLSDIFGQPGHACQATELWRIRCAALDMKPGQNQPAATPHQLQLL